MWMNSFEFVSFGLIFEQQAFHLVKCIISSSLEYYQYLLLRIMRRAPCVEKETLPGNVTTFAPDHSVLAESSFLMGMTIASFVVQVNYHVVCLASEPLVTAAADFFQQLSSGEFW